MIKIELVKFEAQDVITASSVPSTPIINPDGSYIKPQPIACDCRFAKYVPHSKWEHDQYAKWFD